MDERVHTDENDVCPEHFGPGKRDREKNGVARLNVSDGNVVLYVLDRQILWTSMSAVSADPPKAPMFTSNVTCSLARTTPACAVPRTVLASTHRVAAGPREMGR